MPLFDKSNAFSLSVNMPQDHLAPNLPPNLFGDVALTDSLSETSFSGTELDANPPMMFDTILQDHSDSLSMSASSSLHDDIMPIYQVDLAATEAAVAAAELAEIEEEEQREQVRAQQRDQNLHGLTFEDEHMSFDLDVDMTPYTQEPIAPLQTPTTILAKPSSPSSSGSSSNNFVEHDDNVALLAKRKPTRKYTRNQKVIVKDPIHDNQLSLSASVEAKVKAKLHKRLKIKQQELLAREAEEEAARLVASGASTTGSSIIVLPSSISKTDKAKLSSKQRKQLRELQQQQKADKRAKLRAQPLRRTARVSKPVIKPQPDYEEDEEDLKRPYNGRFKIDSSTLMHKPAKRGRPSRSTVKHAAIVDAANAAAITAAAEFAKKKNSKTAKYKAVKLAKKKNPMQITNVANISLDRDLTREELLAMTSEALDEYAARLAAKRPLTAEEQKKFKHQRRLIKNRESAQLSRQRKKAYVDELEQQLAKATNEKTKLIRKFESQAKELDAARQELARFRALLEQNPGMLSQVESGSDEALRTKRARATFA